MCSVQSVVFQRNRALKTSFHLISNLARAILLIREPPIIKLLVTRGKHKSQVFTQVFVPPNLPVKTSVLARSPAFWAAVREVSVKALSALVSNISTHHKIQDFVLLDPHLSAINYVTFCVNSQHASLDVCSRFSTWQD